MAEPFCRRGSSEGCCRRPGRGALRRRGVEPLATVGADDDAVTSGWRRLFGTRGVASIAVVGAIARLPTGMFSLALVLSVASSRSYALAGLTAATYSIALAVAAPVRARAVDRRGAARTIATTSVLQGACSAATASCMLLHLPAGVVLVLAAGCGATTPPVTPALRNLWMVAFDQSHAARAAASSLESMVVDLSYIAGPGLVSVIVLLGPAPLALIAVAVITVSSGIVLTSLASFRRLAGASVPTNAGALVRRTALLTTAVLTLMPVALLAFGSISAIEVAVSALAQHDGHRAAVGALIAVLSVGGITGGLLRGHLARHDARATTRQLLATLAVLTLAWAAPIAIGPLVAVGAVLFAAGMAMNPMISLHYDLLGDRVEPRCRTEAFGWLNAAAAALGSAAAGALAAGSATGGFVTASAMTAIAGLIAVFAAPLLAAREH